MNLVRIISTPVHAQKRLLSDNQLKILHVFDEVCNLINGKQEVLSIVSPEVGNGPFNFVLEEAIMFTRHFDLGAKVLIKENQILIEDLIVSFAYAQEWSPAPNWAELRKGKDEIIHRLSLLQIDYENEALLQFAFPLSKAIRGVDISTTKNISSKLAGLGMGLTPAGDDYLMGAMYAAWMMHPQEVAKKITEEIANAATPLTTSLSGAWLRSAAKGEAGELWHEFFDALIKNENIYLPMSHILSVGETSGSDALMGFLTTLTTDG